MKYICMSDICEEKTCEVYIHRKWIEDGEEKLLIQQTVDGERVWEKNKWRMSRGPNFTLAGMVESYWRLAGYDVDEDMNVDVDADGGGENGGCRCIM